MPRQRLKYARRDVHGHARSETLRRTHAGACGKLAFASRSAANRQVRRLILQGLTDRDRAELLHTYVCPTCDAWHVGHSRPASANSIGTNNT